MLMFFLRLPPPLPHSSTLHSCVVVVAVVTFPCCFPLQHEIVCMPRAIKHNNDAASKFRINTKLFFASTFAFLPSLAFPLPPPPTPRAAFHLFPNAVKAALENDFTHLSHRVRAAEDGEGGPRKMNRKSKSNKIVREMSG